MQGQTVREKGPWSPGPSLCWQQSRRPKNICWLNLLYIKKCPHKNNDLALAPYGDQVFNYREKNLRWRSLPLISCSIRVPGTKRLLWRYAVKADGGAWGNTVFPSNANSVHPWGQRQVAPDITCGNHSESPRAFRKVTSESVGMVLGTQALINFLKLAFTCRMSWNSTGTNSQFKANSNLKFCG